MFSNDANINSSEREDINFTYESDDSEENFFNQMMIMAETFEAPPTKLVAVADGIYPHALPMETSQNVETPEIYHGLGDLPVDIGISVRNQQEDVSPSDISESSGLQAQNVMAVSGECHNQVEIKKKFNDLKIVIMDENQMDVESLLNLEKDLPIFFDMYDRIIEPTIICEDPTFTDHDLEAFISYEPNAQPEIALAMESSSSIVMGLGMNEAEKSNSTSSKRKVNEGTDDTASSMDAKKFKKAE